MGRPVSLAVALEFALITYVHDCQMGCQNVKDYGKIK